MASEAQKAARNLSQGMSMGGLFNQPESTKYLVAGFFTGLTGKWIYDYYNPTKPQPEVASVKDKLFDVESETVKRLQAMDGRMKTLETKLGNIEAVLSRK